MSNTDADSLPSPTLPRAYRLGRAVRWLAGLTIILSLIGLWQAEQRTVDHDLQLVAERSASPGARIAIRALLLSGLQGVDGPRLQGRPVDIQLRAASGEVVAGTTLRVTPNQTMEGVLALPDDAEGRYMLEGRVQLADGVRVTCGRDLEIAPGAGTPRRFLRIAGPLQHFSQGPVVRAETELQPPEMLEMRVLGGACVPEYPCDLGVWVGEPGASLSLRLPSSVDQLQPGDAAQPATTSFTTGLAWFRLVVHGPEARVTVLARRDGILVASRRLRLPVALGATYLHLTPSLASKGEPPVVRIEPAPGRSVRILDLFGPQGWRISHTLDLDADGEFRLADLPGGSDSWLTPGVWRLQARSDPLSVESAGTRMFHIANQGESPTQVLTSVARSGRDAGLGDPLMAGVSERAPAWMAEDAEGWARFMLAERETHMADQPLAVSGRPVTMRRIQRRRNWMRFALGSVLLIAAVVLAVSVARKGMNAADTAHELMLQAGEEAAEAADRRRREGITVLLLAALVMLAFVAAAVLIVARPLWF